LRAIYFAFEESQQQIIRGMASIGLDLQTHVDKGLLTFSCSRPTLYGLETHLAKMHTAVMDFHPKAAVIDPITDLSAMGTRREVHAMLTRLIDFLKSHGVTALLTGMLHDDQPAESAALGVSSLIDTWIQLQALAFGAERNRALFVRKARGMAHSNQIREFLISAKGIQLVDVCVGPEGVLTGSARVAHQMRVDAEDAAREHRQTSLKKERDSRRTAIGARIAAATAELEADLHGLESAFILQLDSDNRSSDAQKLLSRIRNVSVGGPASQRSGESE
jgi:circadian clock protein KaiC